MAIVANTHNRLAREIVKKNMEERKKQQKLQKDQEKELARLETKKNAASKKKPAQ